MSARARSAGIPRLQEIEFLAIAAHEIRGPLNTLHLAVQMLRRGNVPRSAAHEMFDLVERADQRLAQLDQIYGVVHSEINERRMLWLEAIIVIFFAIDLIAIFWLK